MTAAQLKRTRTKLLGWSQARLAEELGVHAQTVSKWERGEQALPKMAAIAVRCFAEHGHD